jgi:hypothetical protein
MDDLDAALRELAKADRATGLEIAKAGYEADCKRIRELAAQRDRALAELPDDVWAEDRRLWNEGWME